MASDGAFPGAAGDERRVVGKMLNHLDTLVEKGLVNRVGKCLLKELLLERDEGVLAAARVLTGIAGGDAAGAEAAVQDAVRRRARRAYEEVYEQCDLERAHLLATTDVDRMPADADTRSLVYGEIEFDAFYEVLQEAARGLPGGMSKFYDLGSGTGRAVFAAVLSIESPVFVGIELLPSLHRAAHEVAERYERVAEPLLASPPVVKLYNGSITAQEYDWSDGSLVFANSTCFDEDLLRSITGTAERLRPGARIITFTVALSSLWLKVVYKKKFSMSWGPATVYVHQKLTESEHAARLEGGADAFDDDQAVAYPLPAGLGRADEEDMDSLLGHATSSHLASTSSRPPSYASSSDIVARDAAVPASLQSNSSESWAMVSPAPSELD